MLRRNRDWCSTTYSIKKRSSLTLKKGRVSNLCQFRAIVRRFRCPRSREVGLIPGRPPRRETATCLFEKEPVVCWQWTCKEDTISPIERHLPGLYPRQRVPGHKIQRDEAMIILEDSNGGIFSSTVSKYTPQFTHPCIDHTMYPT